MTKYDQFNYQTPVTATAQWVNQGYNTTTTTNNGVTYFQTDTVPYDIAGRTPPEPPKPKRPGLLDTVKAMFGRIEGGPMKDPKNAEEAMAALARHGMPMIAGAAAEAEVTKSVEHKKKIVLERTVGVTRDKGSGPEETHAGKVTLVKTMESDDPNQLRNVGIKVDTNGSGHVEIPIDDLREALNELDPPHPPNQTPGQP